ncbi:23S rRNA (pseudouridine(1915)-N(3))-methyltransferase RlmH [Microbacteriaceae bacterium]|nr:23S rRNA (pseudouridine(1915)-N(3))-methyltransferase RlmH [Candidatus Saccharibacteria bacterium]
MIRIIAVGKKHEDWVESGILRYSERLRAPWNVEWILLPHSAREGVTARQEESQAILSRLNDQDWVILLDERGKMYDSPSLSQAIEAKISLGKSVVIVIGGAYGVDETLINRSSQVWSLSPLVFPHQLVRLILAEQLYRAQAIAHGHPYHHS